jgi:hypothetical protein
MLNSIAIVLTGVMLVLAADNLSQTRDTLRLDVQPPAPQRPLSSSLPPGTQSAVTTPGNPDDGVVLVGAGDIANCNILGGARATATLLDGIEGTIFTTGDHAYETGSVKDFQNCYEPTWGRHKQRTRPSIGNHDLTTDRGKPYFDYFGENAGPPGLGYYSYELGTWHIISLNSAQRGNTLQMKWLRDDLAVHQTDCVLAYWHVARFSSGAHGSDPVMADVWKLLFEAGADVVLSSHDHDYERFAPMDDKGKADSVRGIREFVVGTGGGGVYEFKRAAENSEVRSNKTYGVLKLTLKPGKYDWEFIPMAGQTFRDSGSGTCSGR